MSNLRPATVADFERLENPSIGDKCHVSGWAKGAVFIVDAVDGAIATIKTRATNKRFTVPVYRLLRLAK